jgi:hypothetical protein
MIGPAGCGAGDSGDQARRFPQIGVPPETGWAPNGVTSGSSVRALLRAFAEVGSNALILLHHKFRRDVFRPIEAAQHGHRDKDLMSVTINRRRMVAMEFGR